jgi:hypothetical protein
MHKAIGLAAAISGVALVLAGAAFADTTPAPDGTASAVAAQVGDVLAIGQTAARSGTSDAEATANALSLGGKPPASQFGGSTKSADDSDASGNLIDTGSTPLGRVQVTPWEAHTRKPSSATNNCRTANGKAALARVTVVDEKTGQVNVLQSQSDAAHCGLTSTGSSSGDGATVNLGGDSGLLLVLLHSQADSSGKGHTFLVSLNGNEIGTDDQAGGQCAIPADPILNLVCLTVGGGNGSAFADVAKLAVGGGALNGTVVGAEGKGSPAAQPQVQDVQIDSGDANAAPAAPADSGVFSGSLARTGSELGAMALLGGMLVALGETTRRRFRRA